MPVAAQALLSPSQIVSLACAVQFERGNYNNLMHLALLHITTLLRPTDRRYFYWIFMWIIMVFRSSMDVITCMSMSIIVCLSLAALTDCECSVFENTDRPNEMDSSCVHASTHTNCICIYFIRSDLLLCDCLLRMKEINCRESDFGIFKCDSESRRMAIRMGRIETVDRWRECTKFAFLV